MKLRTSFGLSLLRLIGQTVLTLAMMPVQIWALAVKSPMRVTYPIRYHRNVLKLFGFRVSVFGQPAVDGPTLFISNHISYFDIEVLGSILPASFVAKQEVARWPVFGMLAKLQRTVFIDRRVHSTRAQRDSLTERLLARENIILFPEGTSNDGNFLLPFRSSLFSAAEVRVDGKAVIVQPVTLAYIKLNGMPIGRSMRPYFAWYGDMELSGHLLKLLGLGITEVSVQFHSPVTIDSFQSRKTLSAYCERVIATGLAAANAGRIDAPPMVTELESCPSASQAVAPA